MEAYAHPTESPNFAEKILTELAEIKRRLDTNTSPPGQLSDRYFQPKEVCATYGINRQTLEKFFKANLLTPLRFDPKGRKIYIAESEIKLIFKSQLPNRLN